MVHRSSSVQQDPTHKMFESQRIDPTASGNKPPRVPKAPKPQGLAKAPRQHRSIDISRFKPDWGVLTPTWKKAGAVLLAYTALTWNHTPYIDEHFPDVPLVDPASPFEMIGWVADKLDGSSNNSTSTPATSVLPAPGPTTLVEAQPQTVPTTIPVVGVISPTTIAATSVVLPQSTIASIPETIATVAANQAFQSGRIICSAQVPVDFQSTDKYVFNAIERTEGPDSHMAHIADPDATNLWDQWVSGHLGGRAPQHGETFEAPAGCNIPSDLILP